MSISKDKVGGLSQRQRRVGEEVRKLLSQALLREDFHIEGFNGAEVTISEVRMSPDLRHAFAFVMPLGGAKLDETMVILKQVAPKLRHTLSKKMHLRVSPLVHFKADETFDVVDKLEAALRSDHVAQDIKPKV